MAMAQYIYHQDIHGNPSSLDHAHGLSAAIALQKARITIAKFINAESPECIMFTSGATESNNIILHQYYGELGDADIIISPLEHKSITEYPIHSKYVLPLKNENDLSVDFELLTKTIELKSFQLISCIGASNEIGTILPIHEIGAFCKTHKIKFHCDATQLAPWQKIDVQSDNIDYLSLSAHKMYGPKGIGILYAKDPEKLRNLTFGGKQEFTKRPGTQNMIGIIGFARAIKMIEEDREADIKRIGFIRSKMEKIFHEEFRNMSFMINGGKNRIPNNLSLTFYGLRPGLLELVNTWISVSSGSACQEGFIELSSVLKWLGHTNDSQTLRIGLGRFTKESDGDEICKRIIETVKTLR